MNRFLAGLWATLFLAAAARADDLNLAGPWSVLLDPQNSGQATLSTPAGWQNKETLSVTLPGSIQSQKVGDLPSARSPWTARIGLSMLNNAKYLPYQKEGDFKTPFWLTPDRVYVGSAWFNRDITVPASFANQRILLTLERPHWETTLFIDGKQAGLPQNSLGTPHVYDVTDALPPGKHTLIVRVDNRLKIPVGNDASAVTDQTQSNWNGIVGDLKLSTTKKIWIDDVQVYPDVANKKIRVEVAIGNKTGKGGQGSIGGAAIPLNMEDPPKPTEMKPITWDERGGKASFEIQLGPNAKIWDEFSPNLYKLVVQMVPAGIGDPAPSPDAGVSPVITTFGLRQISTKGPQLLLNHHPLQLRGTLECCIFPLTGYPPTGPAGAPYWKKIYSQLKAFGLNHLRFHSWCPPEIAFQVADEMGIYLQIEGGVWAAFGSSGRPPSTEPEAPDAGGRGGASLDAWIVKEAAAMLRTYGNHPSFLLMASANEPGSRTNAPNAAFLSALLTQWKAADPRHLYTAGSNWPNVPEADFQVMSRPRMNGSNELTRPPQTTSDYSAIVREYPNQPVISHETGQWCVYPNFDEIKKYTGSLHPGNLEIFQDFLVKAGMGDQARDFLMASGKFQLLLYKEEIEALLRTPQIGGFQLLDLHDFPGQGTAPVGVLDAFWDEKPYVTAAEYQRFAGATVPLALMSKRIYTANETFNATIKLSNFGEASLTSCAWTLKDPTGNTLASGSFNPKDVQNFSLSDLGAITVPLEKIAAPAKLALEVDVVGLLPVEQHRVAQHYKNDWDIWVYPAPSSPATASAPDTITTTTSLPDALTALAAGKNVLLLPPIASIAGNTQGSFAPIFWNRITFPNATYHTLSILCDPKHPAFATFPTDFHSNWQWSELQQRGTCKPMLLTSLPKDLKPLVQFIDDWDQARKLALLLEVKIEGRPGKLLLSSIDLTSNLPTRPVARQLLSSLQSYLASDKFNPPTTITEPQLRSLLQ